MTDARLNETDYTYDTYGNRLTVTNGLDKVWTYYCITIGDPS